MITNISQTVADFIRDVNLQLGGAFEKIVEIDVDEQSGIITWSVASKSFKLVKRLSGKQKQHNFTEVTDAIKKSTTAQLKKNASSFPDKAKQPQSTSHRVITIVAENSSSQKIGKSLARNIVNKHTGVIKVDTKDSGVVSVSLNVVSLAIKWAISTPSEIKNHNELTKKLNRKLLSLQKSLADAVRKPDSIDLNNACQLITESLASLKSIQKEYLNILQSNPTQLPVNERIDEVLQTVEIQSAKLQKLQT